MAGSARATRFLRNALLTFRGRRRGHGYSTVTDFARLRGLSTSVPRASAA
jgi:hypothetical protein